MPTHYSPYVADDPVQDALIASRAVHNRPRFDFNDRGPAMMERKIAEKMLQDKAQIQAGQRVSIPLTTGEMVPSIGTEPTRLEQAAPRAPTQVTLPSNERAARGRPFDTATEGRLRNVPGAYEEAVRNLVPQAPMTAKNETTGESFVAQPAPRMDRRALEQLIARKMLEEQERKGQAQLDAARQHDLTKARIPGDASLALTKQQAADKERLEELRAAREQPLTEAKLKQIDAEIAGIKQRNQQAATAFENTQDEYAYNKSRRLTPEQENADRLYDSIKGTDAESIASKKLIWPKTSYAQIGSDIPDLSDAIHKPNMTEELTRAQEVLNSDPVLSSDLNSLITFAKKLTDQTLLHTNYQDPADLNKLKIKFNTLVQKYTSRGIPQNIAEQIVRAKIDQAIPAEGPEGPIAKKFRRMGEFSPTGEQVGTPGRAVGNVRGYLGLD